MNNIFLNLVEKEKQIKNLQTVEIPLILNELFPGDWRYHSGLLEESFPYYHMKVNDGIDVIYYPFYEDNYQGKFNHCFEIIGNGNHSSIIKLENFPKEYKQRVLLKNFK